jgi:hypothetical protein
MPDTIREFRFCWWNLHNFAHFDPDRTTDPRWPDRQVDFDAKRDRIRAALAALFDVGGWPDLLATCEITRPAAQQLLAVLPQGY